MFSQRKQVEVDLRKFPARAWCGPAPATAYLDLNGGQSSQVDSPKLHQPAEVLRRTGSWAGRDCKLSRHSPTRRDQGSRFFLWPAAAHCRLEGSWACASGCEKNPWPPRGEAELWRGCIARLADPPPAPRRPQAASVVAISAAGADPSRIEPSRGARNHTEWRAPPPPRDPNPFIIAFLADSATLPRRAPARAIDPPLPAVTRTGASPSPAPPPPTTTPYPPRIPYYFALSPYRPFPPLPPPPPELTMGATFSKDSQATVVLEGVPVVGFVVGIVHAVRKEADRAKRTAAKAANSTLGVAGAIAGGVVLGPLGATLGGALGGLLGHAAEGGIAKTVEDPIIKEKLTILNTGGFAVDAVHGAIGGALASVGSFAVKEAGLSRAVESVVTVALASLGQGGPKTVRNGTA